MGGGKNTRLDSLSHSGQGFVGSLSKLSRISHSYLHSLHRYTYVGNLDSPFLEWLAIMD